MSDSRSIRETIAEEGFSSFEDMFKKTYPALVSYAAHFISEKDAEDVVQDLFVYIISNSGRIFVRGPLMPYLYTAAKNRALAFLDKQGTHARIISSLRLKIIDSALETSPLSTEDVLTCFEKALEQLPEEQREAFELSRYRDMSYEQIAAVQGVSRKAVQYRVKVAVEKLSAILAEVLPVALIAILIETTGGVANSLIFSHYAKSSRQPSSFPFSYRGLLREVRPYSGGGSLRAGQSVDALPLSHPFAAKSGDWRRL